MIKLKDAPLSKRKSTPISMGLICLCCVALGCSPEAPKYLIDIDRLADTDPEVSDKRLKEMVSVQLVHDDKWGDHHGAAEEWLVEGWRIGKVVHRRYKLMEEPSNSFGQRTMIHIDFNHFERTYKFWVIFNEFVARREALRRLGFDSKGLLKHPFLPDAWLACIKDGVRIYRVKWLDDGGASSVHVISLD